MEKQMLHITNSSILTNLLLELDFSGNIITSLIRKGHEAMLKQHYFSNKVKNALIYGGIRNMDFQLSKKYNRLVKTSFNAY